VAKTVEEPAREIPVWGEYDVIVVGGGVAGVAAAVAAARNGARVCLIEKAHALGGLATLGLVVYYLPLCDGRGNQVIGGLGEEMLRLAVRYGPGKVPDCWNGPGDIEQRTRQRFSVRFNPASYAIALDEFVLDAGVKVLFDTRFCGVLGGGGRIEAVVVECKSGRGALVCKTVVDASGDADVCFAAGERTACLHTNTRSAWFYSSDGCRVDLQVLHDPICPADPGDLMTFDGDDVEGVTQLDIESRRMILQKVRSLAEEAGGEVWPLILPTLPQFRMTRRLAGALELDAADRARWFDDSVGMTGDWREAGEAYFLPYRCIAAVRTANLFAAGRCVSVTRSGWDVVRAIPGCVVTGQAAGTAAALTIKAGVGVREVDYAALQESLADQGVPLPAVATSAVG